MKSIPICAVFGLLWVSLGSNAWADSEVHRNGANVHRSHRFQAHGGHHRNPSHVPSLLRLGNGAPLDFTLNPLLKSHDRVPGSIHSSGIHIGSWWFLEEAPPTLYNGNNLPASIREDGWYLPTTLELVRIPKLF
jgi:hypothetical protein